MSFLRVNGWPIRVAIESVNSSFEIVEEDTTSERNDQIIRRRRMNQTWDMKAVHREASVADAIEGIIAGLGHHFTFDTNLFSTRGRAPNSTAGATIVAGKFGNGASVTSLSYTFDSGIQNLEDAWTVIVYRQEAGLFVHYGIRDDGAVFVNGVRDDSMDTSWLTVSGNTLILTGAPTVFDDLVVLLFSAPDEAIVAWHNWQTDENRPFSDLPSIIVDGDFLRSTQFEALGEVSSNQYETFGGEPQKKDGNWWKNNGRSAEFSLMLRNNTPRVFIPRPVFHLSLDNEQNVSGNPNNLAFPLLTFTTVAPVTIGVVGQVGQAYLLTGGHVAAVSSGTGAFVTGSFFSGGAWVNLDASAANTEHAVIGKRNDGTGPGYMFITKTNAGATGAQIQFGTHNTLGTLGRVLRSVPTIPFNEWHHVAWSYKGDATSPTDRIRLFIDGVKVETTTISDTDPGAIANANLLAIGRVVSGGAPANARLLLGSVDEPVMWGDSLSGAQIFDVFLRGARQQAMRYLRG